MKRKKNWCDGKTKEEIEDEIWRLLSTYDIMTIRKLFFDLLTEKEKIFWVNEYHKEY